MCGARPPNNQHQSIIAKVLCVFLVFYSFFFINQLKSCWCNTFFFVVETGQIDTPERGAGKSKSGGKGPGKGKEGQRSSEASLYLNFKLSDTNFTSPQTTQTSFLVFLHSWYLCYLVRLRFIFCYKYSGGPQI